MPGEVRQRRRQAERPVTSHRELVGEYGIKLAELWWSIASDPMRRDSDRLDASRLLADRGKPANFEPQEGDPRGLEDAEKAAEWFRAEIVRLAEGPESDRA
jgi:hypothetical protein